MKHLQARPLLGWYDESDPANVDWQIKWAVEHGISSFCVCWYWNKGEQRLDHKFWGGMVNELWFEGVDLRHATVEIDWMRFEP